MAGCHIKPKIFLVAIFSFLSGLIFLPDEKSLLWKFANLTFANYFSLMRIV